MAPVRLIITWAVFGQAATMENGPSKKAQQEVYDHDGL